MTSAGPFSAPKVAWPTLALAAASLGAWAACWWGAWASSWPAWAVVLVGTLAAYVSFTPLHEATHGALCLHRRPVNALVGRLAALPLMAPFLAFRFFHLEHHRHTNDPHLDADYWSGRGPGWARPLRWMTQDLHYYARYLRGIRTRPLAESLETVPTMVLLIGGAIALAAAGYGREVLLCWVLPSRLAIGVLAFSFDYLPHRPHTVLAAVDRYRTTRIIEGPLLDALLLGQNLHLLHHLYPGLPFYRYRAMWTELRPDLLRRGVEVVTLPARRN